MTIDETQPHPLARAVRAYVATGSGLAPALVIPGNDKGPRPKEPYASLLLVDDGRRGFPEVVERDGGDLTITPRAAAWSVQWYRAGAGARALRFASWLEDEAGIDAAGEAGFSVVVPVAVNRLDEIAGDAFEERAQMDLTCRWLYSRAQNADTLERVRSRRDGRRGAICERHSYYRDGSTWLTLTD